MKRLYEAKGIPTAIMSNHSLLVTLLLFISLQEAYIRQEKQNTTMRISDPTIIFLPFKVSKGASYPHGFKSSSLIWVH